MNPIWTSGRTSLGTGWTALFIGVWLIISPFALGITHDLAGVANNIVVGIAMILLTIASTRNGLLRGLVLLLGAWLWASAFILSVPSETYLWNNLILAIVTVITSVASETPYPPNYRPK